MNLKHEPASETLYISATWLFLNRELRPSPCTSPPASLTQPLYTKPAPMFSEARVVSQVICTGYLHQLFAQVILHRSFAQEYDLPQPPHKKSGLYGKSASLPQPLYIKPPPMSSEARVVCSGSEAGSYLRLVDFVYDSILALRVMKKKKKV